MPSSPRPNGEGLGARVPVRNDTYARSFQTFATALFPWFLESRRDGGTGQEPKHFNNVFLLPT